MLDPQRDLVTDYALIATGVAAALIALILVLLSVWLVLTARRLLRRLLEPKRPQAG